MMTMRRFAFNPFPVPAARAMDDLLDSVFEGLVAGFPVGSHATNGESNGSARTISAPVNIWESDEALFIECELPGFAINDVEITVLKNRLMLSGTRQARSCHLPENAKALRQERVGERFSRVIDLPMPVDFDKASAHLTNGVLEITLPKAQQAKPRRIEVVGR